MNTKRILFVTPYFAPAWGYGGPPRINYDLAKYLVGQGYEVEVTTTDVLSGTERNANLSEVMDGIVVKRFPNLSNWLAWQGKLFFPRGFTSYLKTNIDRFDFVFLSDFRDFQNAVAYQLCLEKHIPYGLAAYGSLPRVGGTRIPIKYLYDALWGTKMIQGARYLLGQTDHELALYQQLGGRAEQMVLLPLGIDAKKIHRSGGKEFRQKYGLGDNEHVLLFVGRINYLKGIDFLVEGLAELTKKLPAPRLVIVGRDDGYYLRRLEKLVHEYKLDKEIIFTGPLYGDEVYPAYAAADLFVFTPRHYEETSLACLTALALGTPVITTHEASIPFLEKYGAGYEINRAQDEFIQKTELLLTDKEQRRTMGEQGKKLIADVFDLPQVGAKFEELIRKAIDE